MPVVVRLPLIVVLPPLPVLRLLIPVKFAPTKAVVPLKSRTRLLAPPATPAVNVGVVPVSVRVAAAPVKVTKPVYP